jgi:hypothetical protein
MTRQRTSPALETAQRRLNGLKYLNPSLDLGNGVSVEQFTILVEQLNAKLTTYNSVLAELDDSRIEIETLEKKLKKLSERMLITMASLYGKESDEYEIAGGVKRVSRKTAAPKTSASPANAEMLKPIVSANESGVKNGSQNGKSEATVS